MDQNLINFFYEIGTLRRLMRSYHLNLHTDTETVAEHSHRVAIIAYFLAKQAGANIEKVLMMALFHDMPETRTGDSNWIQKNYVEQNEEAVISGQLEPLGEVSKDLRDLLVEYKERKSLESKVAKDADVLEYTMSLCELAVTGNKEAIHRLKTENMQDTLRTEQAKNLMDLIKRTDPNDWSRPEWAKTHEKYKTTN